MMDGTADGAPKIYNMRDADALDNIPDYDASKDVLGSDYANQVNASLTLGRRWWSTAWCAAPARRAHAAGAR